MLMQEIIAMPNPSDQGATPPLTTQTGALSADPSLTKPPAKCTYGGKPLKAGGPSDAPANLGGVHDPMFEE